MSTQSYTEKAQSDTEVEVHLFGSLRRYAPPEVSGPGTTFFLAADGAVTVGRVLEAMGIEAGEVGNLFLNGRLLPRSTYPLTLGYPSTADRPLSAQGWLDTQVVSGDRLGIFPPTMSLVVV